MKILFATRNRGKLAELKKLLCLDIFEIVCLDDLDVQIPNIEETGSTFAENAYLKASKTAEFTGLPSLADDSGLVVDALNGEPGIHSARYAGPNVSDNDRNMFLLEKLKDVPPQKRTARFWCAIAFVDPQKPQYTQIFEGTCEGEILEKPRGIYGFGYDPLFYFPKMGKSFAELSKDEKNLVSHRGNAMVKMANFLQNSFSSD